MNREEKKKIVLEKYSNYEIIDRYRGFERDPDKEPLDYDYLMELFESMDASRVIELADGVKPCEDYFYNFENGYLTELGREYETAEYCVDNDNDFLDQLYEDCTTETKTEKRKTRAFGKDIYFLGRDSEGVAHWLEAGSWDCGWYWGFGYVETYTNNEHPERSRDISSHTHFDGLKQNGGNMFDNFKEKFVDTPLNDSEIWKLCELMETFYISNKYARALHCGGAHYTENPAKETIKNDTEYERINKKVIPEIMDQVYKLLSPENKGGAE